MIIDTHAHYDDAAFDGDREALIESLPENGIGIAVDIGASPESSRKALALSGRYDHIYAAIGVHPDDVDKLDEDELSWLEKTAAAEKKVVAIGEIGMDYYWDNSPHDVQKYWFRRQLELARRVGLPVVIHSRDAAKDTFDVLKEAHAEELGGVIHCYSGSAEMAKEYVKLGWYLGIGGVVTFKNARVIKEVTAQTDLSHIVLETDCPYLAPVPYRGKRNSSLYLPYVVQAISEIKGVSPEEVIRVTEENARRMYRI